MRRALWAFLIAIGFTAIPLPLLLTKWQPQSVAGKLVWFVGMIWAVPGGLVSVLASGGNFHDDLNMTVMTIANFVVYLGIGFLASLGWERHRKTTSGRGAQTPNAPTA
jgi:hypothetical protein